LFLSQTRESVSKRLILVVINHTLLFVLLDDPDEMAERESGFIFPK